MAEWASEMDASLLNGIVKYLESIQSRSNVDEDTLESLQIATDCLSSIVNETLATSYFEPVSLENLYNQSKSSSSGGNPAPSRTVDPVNRSKFLKFAKSLGDKGFFSQCDGEINSFYTTLAKVRTKYNAKFAQLAVPSLYLLQIVVSDVLSDDSLRPFNHLTVEGQLRALESYREPSDKSENIYTRESKSDSKSDDDNDDENQNDGDDDGPLIEEPNDPIGDDGYTFLKTREEVTDIDRKKAIALKDQGNTFLGKKKIRHSIDKYTQAIDLDPYNAVFYSNRAAAYTHLKNYEAAVEDAKKSIFVNPDYVKGYIRLAVAEQELGHFEEARDAYDEALQRTDSSKPSWEKWMGMKMKLDQMIEKKADLQDRASGRNSRGGANPFAGGMPGGMGGLADLLGAMGGGGGGGGGGPGAGGGMPGGMGGLAGLLQNPMMQKMAQQVMQNPEMMAKVSDMMSDPRKQKEMADMMGNPDVQNLLGGMAGNGEGGGAGGGGLMDEFMKDPAKAKAAMQSAMNDPEVVELKSDPEIGPLINRVKGGDFTAMAALAGKPRAAAVIKRLVKKYMK